MRAFLYLAGLALLAAACSDGEPAAPAGAADTLRIPLTDFGAGDTYLGFPGFLYPGGNVPPAAHDSVGIARALAVVPLDTAGNPDPGGTIVLLSVGMSNTTQEFCSQSGGLPCDPWTLMGKAAADASVNQTTLVIANGARGGQAATTWDAPSDANYDRVRDSVLAPQGRTERQVQVVWVKQANPGPTASLPAAPADVYRLEASLGAVVRALVARYPNLRQVFFSSRIYGGYATTTLNPEPYAYESAFAVKWLIGAQIRQGATSAGDSIAGDLDYRTTPWLGWAAYLWADGLTARSDGLTWSRPDFASDGTHPAQPGEDKVATLLLGFFKSSPYTNWFTDGGSCP